jgi:hypothetical protein
VGLSVGAVVPDSVLGGSVVAGSDGPALPEGSAVVVGAGVSSTPEAEVEESSSPAAEVDDGAATASSPEGEGEALKPQDSAAEPTPLP